MKTYRYILFIWAIFSTNTVVAGLILPPQSIKNLSGNTSGALNALTVDDQIATADSPGKYMSFATQGLIYKGYISYLLPANTPRASINSLKLQVNYKGEVSSRQTWNWYVYNWPKAQWTKIGSNVDAKNNFWSHFVFNILNPQAYIKATTGEIRILMQSNNAVGNAKIDYEAVLVNMPTLAGCSMFPANDVWNTPVDTLPVHDRSNSWISTIGSDKHFHMDFGSGLWDGGAIGIPYNTVAGSQVTQYNVDFYYPDESDAGPYPIPINYKQEYGSDHHVLIVDSESCKLFEIYDAWYNQSWSGGSGAIWNMNSNHLRRAGWTSADAAGLPILPGLLRYEEVAAGAINHAIRFTVPMTNSYVWPARHLTSGIAGTLTDAPPMGARFRLKANFNISGFDPKLQVILKAMKTYGIINADNGSAWFVSGVPDQHWDNDMLHRLDVLQGSNFEAVDSSCMMVNANSGQADLGKCR